MGDSRKKYTRKDLEHAISVIDGGRFGLGFRYRQGYLWMLWPTVEADPRIAGPLYQQLLDRIPNLPKELNALVRDDLHLCRWMTNLSFHPEEFQEQFLVDWIKGSRRESSDTLLTLVQKLVRLRSDFPTVATMMAATNDGHLPDRDKERAYNGLLRRVLRKGLQSVRTAREHGAIMESIRSESRAYFGYKAEERRKSVSLRKIALYLWANLILRGASPGKASTLLNAFFRRRKCGCRQSQVSYKESNGNPPVLAKQEPPRSPECIYIWKPAVRKGHRIKPTWLSFDRMMYSEMKTVLKVRPISSDLYR